MPKLISSLILCAATFHGPAAWPAISSAAWKVFFKTLAQESSLTPGEIGKIGLLLKTAESPNKSLDPASAEALAIHFRNVTTDANLAKEAEGKAETATLDDNTIHLLANLFSDFPHLDFNKWADMLTDLEDLGVFSSREISQLDQLRAAEIKQKKAVMLGITPELSEKVDLAREQLGTFLDFNFQEMIGALLQISGLRGKEADKVRIYFMANGPGDAKRKYQFLLKFAIVKSVIDDPEFNAFFQVRLAALFSESPPKWLWRMEQTLSYHPISEENATNIYPKVFLAARRQAEREEVLSAILWAGVGSGVVTATLTSPWWIPALFSAEKN